MGDSNIARLPAHRMLNLQMDAFPGATFQTAETILRETQTTDVVKKVILSFGLNDKALRSMETTTEQLLNMLVRAKEAFPKAQIFIPQVNFSRALPTKEKLRLAQINKFIKSLRECLPMLDESEFKTDSDDLHWSRETAAKLMEHWIRHLN